MSASRVPESTIVWSGSEIRSRSTVRVPARSSHSQGDPVNVDSAFLRGFLGHRRKKNFPVRYNSKSYNVQCLELAMESMR